MRRLLGSPHLHCSRCSLFNRAVGLASLTPRSQLLPCCCHSPGGYLQRARTEAGVQCSIQGTGPAAAAA